MRIRKIVVACDSFKGSLSSKEVADSVADGVAQVASDIVVEKVAVADGGEGTSDVIVESNDGVFVSVRVHNPLMQMIEAKYGIIDNGKTAVIEMAAASGLPLIAQSERNPMLTTTFGTGEMIADAIKKGCRQFIVCIGGSATNDAGMGMLSALGYKFRDAANNDLFGCGGNLAKIDKIDDSGVLNGLSDCTFRVACDVTNPFSGKNGAAYIFGPQKGADPVMVEQLDRGMENFSQVIKQYNGIDVQSIEGSGAAGGLGGALVAFLNARLIKGIDIVLEAVNFDKKLENADLVITGEGKIDAQTAMGKAPKGVLLSAQKRNIPVVAIAGAVEDLQSLIDAGFMGAFSIVQSPISLREAMQSEKAKQNIEATIINIVTLLLSK